MWAMLARIGKLVALFGFVLPWATVSCAQQPIAHLTGLNLLTGSADITNPMTGAVQQQHFDPIIMLIGAAGAIVVGLILGVLTRNKTAGAIMLISAIAAIVLTVMGFGSIEGALARERTSSGEGAPYEEQLRTNVAAQIAVAPEAGYWTTLGGLGIAVIGGVLVLIGAPGLVVRRENAPPS